MTAAKELEAIGEAEGLALAATVPVGRLVFSHLGLPAVHLVSFKLDGKDIVFRTREGAKFADTVVAFEVDRIDEDTHSGWTVTLLGRAKLVTDPTELDQAAQPGGDRHYCVRIRTQMVTGRKISPQAYQK